MCLCVCALSLRNNSNLQAHNTGPVLFWQCRPLLVGPFYVLPCYKKWNVLMQTDGKYTFFFPHFGMRMCDHATDAPTTFWVNQIGHCQCYRKTSMEGRGELFHQITVVIIVEPLPPLRFFHNSTHFFVNCQFLPLLCIPIEVEVITSVSFPLVTNGHHVFMTLCAWPKQFWDTIHFHASWFLFKVVSRFLLLYEVFLCISWVFHLGHLYLSSLCCTVIGFSNCRFVRLAFQSN